MVVRRVRKSKVTREEFLGDMVFLLIGFIVSFLAIFFFDTHHSFYEEPWFPLEFIFSTPTPYYVGVPVGGIVIFLIIKLFLFGVEKEEEGE
jgi:hypothetical protein